MTELTTELLSRPFSYFQDIQRLLAPRIRRTALTRSPGSASSGISGEVWLKHEHEQHTGAFKARGAVRAVQLLPPGTRGMVSATAGNGGAGLAYATAPSQLPTIIVAPLTMPASRVSRLVSFGAHVEVIRHGETWDDARDAAIALAADRGFEFIHPFDSVGFIEGAATIAVEILEDMPGTQSIIVPVGGGGLLAGVCLAAKAFDRAIRVYGVEPEGAAGMTAALAAGKPVTLAKVETIASSLAVRRVGDRPFEIVRQLADGVMVVSDDQLRAAVRATKTAYGFELEAAAAAVFALPGMSIRDQRGGPDVAVVTGGAPRQ